MGSIHRRSRPQLGGDHCSSRVGHRWWEALTTGAALVTAAGWRSPQQPRRSPPVGGAHRSRLVGRRKWVALTATASSVAGWLTSAATLVMGSAHRSSRVGRRRSVALTAAASSAEWRSPQLSGAHRNSLGRRSWVALTAAAASVTAAASSVVVASPLSCGDRRRPTRLLR